MATQGHWSYGSRNCSTFKVSTNVSCTPCQSDWASSMNSDVKMSGYNRMEDGCTFITKQPMNIASKSCSLHSLMPPGTIRICTHNGSDLQALASMRNSCQLEHPNKSMSRIACTLAAIQLDVRWLAGKLWEQNRCTVIFLMGLLSCPEVAADTPRRYQNCYSWPVC